MNIIHNGQYGNINIEIDMPVNNDTNNVALLTRNNVEIG